MGDYRTVVKHWSITHTLLHPSTLLLPFDGVPSRLGGENYELSNKQTKAQKKFKSWLLWSYGANNETHLCYLGQTLYLVLIWACKKHFQHMKPSACVRLWIYEDSQLVQHNKTLLIMYSDISSQLSPGWTCIKTICRNKGLIQRKRTLILRQCTLVRPVCVCVRLHVLMWCRQHTFLPKGLARGA